MQSVAGNLRFSFFWNPFVPWLFISNELEALEASVYEWLTVEWFTVSDSETTKLDAATGPLPIAEQYWGIYVEVTGLSRLPGRRLFGWGNRQHISLLLYLLMP